MKRQSPPNHRAPRETCERCGSVLPGRVTHDTEADCLATLVARCRLSDNARKTIRKQLDNATARLESWKVKALTRDQASPAPGTIVTGKRLAILEAKAEAADQRERQMSERMGQMEQRVAFLMNELERKPPFAAVPAGADLRRAS